MIVLLPHSVVFVFFLTFDGTIFKLYSTKITYDCTFVRFGGSIFFFLANGSSIVTSGSSNITFDHTFLTFGCTLIFFSHIWWCRPHIVQYQHHMWLYFCHIWHPLYFFITFDGSIVTLGGANITLYRTFLTLHGTFVTFDGSFFFFFPHQLP